MEQVQGVAFFDSDTLTINRNAYAADANTRSIAGAGVGINAQYSGVQLKTTLAWPSSGGQAQSEPASLSNNLGLWAQVNCQL
jgi:hypothetical protein